MPNLTEPFSGTRRLDDIQFDPNDLSFAETGVPFEKLARIRRECPVYKTSDGAWYLSRFEDVEAALRDHEAFRPDLGPITGIPGGLEAIPEDEHFLSEIPEPAHKDVRRLYNNAMTAPRLKALEPILEQECNRLVDAMLAKPVADLHADYALQIPAIAMMHLMGLERDAVGCFARWSTDGALMTRPSTPSQQGRAPAIHAYFAEKLNEQRVSRSNHVFTQFIDAEVDGRRLTDREIVTQLQFMIMAGVHTTRSLLAHLMNRIVQTAELFSRLENDRKIIPLLVEESLRHDSPVQRTTRRCARHLTLAGVAMAAGDWVEVGIGSANRDEARYENAEDFLLDRTGMQRHVAFGSGAHVCPGSALARLEATTAVNVLLTRCSAAQEVPGAVYPPIPGSLGHQPIPAQLVQRRS